MGSNSYRENLWQRRLTRRSALRGIGGAALATGRGGGAIGCGSPSAPAALPSSVSIAAPAAAGDSTSTATPLQPKRGGTLRFPTTGTYPHMDVQLNASATLAAFG